MILLWAKDKSIEPFKTYNAFDTVKIQVNSYILWYYFDKLVDVFKYVSAEKSAHIILKDYNSL